MTPPTRFDTVCRALARGHRRALAAALVLGAALTPFAVRTLLHLDTNLVNQAGDALPRFQAMRWASETFGGETFVAVVSIPDAHTAEDVAALKELGTLLSAELAAARDSRNDIWLNDVACSTRQFGGDARALAWQYPQVLLRAEDVPKIQMLFEPAALDRSLEELAQTLRELAPQSPEKALLYVDPLKLAERLGALARERIQSAARALADRDGWFLSRDETLLAVLGHAAQPAAHLEFSRGLLNAAQAAAERARTEFLKRHPGTIAPTIGFTGAAAIYVENDATLKSDVALNLATSLLGVVLLFAVLYRSWGITWKVVATTVYTIWITLGVAGLWRERIGVLGAAFTAVPVGLVTDYAILVVNRFQRARTERTGAGVEECRVEAVHAAAPSVLVAAGVTALAFFGVGAMQLRGLSEFGILGGVSALLGCVVMLSVLPALLNPCDGGACGIEKNEPGNSRRTGVIALGLVLFAGAIGVIALGSRGETDTVAGVRFDSELGNLRASGGTAVPLRQRLAERFGMGLSEISVVVESRDSDRVLDACAEVRKRLEPFVARGELRCASGVLDSIPGFVLQSTTIDAWKQFDFAGALRNFDAAVTKRFGVRGLKYFAGFRARVNEVELTLKNAQPVSLRELLQSPAGKWLAPFAATTSSNAMLRTVWLPNEIDRPREWYERLTTAVESPIFPGATLHVVAAKLTGFELKDSTLRDCGWITAVGGAAVALLLLAVSRSPSRAALMTIPLLFGWAFMLAGVPLSAWLHWDYSLNFINLAMIPLLLGSAADYGVFMVFALDDPAANRHRVRRAVLFCILTTVIGFGSFVTSSFSGLRSLGVASLWGYAGASFGALILLPALLGPKRDAT
jgi:predicted exporter